MRIGTTQQRGEGAPLYNVYYIVLPNSLKYTLLETFLWRYNKCANFFLVILSILMMANMAIASLMAKYPCSPLVSNRKIRKSKL